MPKILVISFSPIVRDARVLRQLSLLTRLGDVSTIGYGEVPEGVQQHFRVPDGAASLPQTPLGVLKLALRAHRAVENTSPAARAVLGMEIPDGWDLVVANDARVLDLAFTLSKGAPVWADMHEWAPEERTHIRSWKYLVAPFMTELCRLYLPKAALVTTVGDEIAALYQTRFGVTPALMTNATHFRELSPSPSVAERIRCVHSGAAIHGRGLERMVEVFRDLPERYSLDLYLVPGGDGGKHLATLRETAANDPRITFHEPVAPEALPTVLSAYDVGVFWIPPTHTNARLTLPNKFFDYVQARLGVAIGPSIEMTRLLERFDLGVVSASFDEHDLRASLLDVTPERVEAFKRASDVAARELSFENTEARIAPLVEALLDPVGPPAAES